MSANGSTAHGYCCIFGPPTHTHQQSYGGTSIQFWMSEAALRQSAAPVATQCCKQDGGPSCLWNTQIAPYTLGPTQLQGVLWYQVRRQAQLTSPAAPFHLPSFDR
eukprot:SAG22_NODE_453_length_10316_cov_27.583341_2_plen_105_part_00